MSKKTGKRGVLTVSARMVAEVVGCSISQVRKMRAGKRGKRATKLQENILVAESLLRGGSNELIDQVKKTVKF